MFENKLKVDVTDKRRDMIFRNIIENHAQETRRKQYEDIELC